MDKVVGIRLFYRVLQRLIISFTFAVKRGTC